MSMKHDHSLINLNYEFYIFTRALIKTLQVLLFCMLVSENPKKLRKSMSDLLH